MDAQQMNQADLAEAVGVSHVTVYRWIDEEAVPRSDVLLRVADALKLPVEDVLNAASATAVARAAGRRLRHETDADVRTQVASLRAERERLIAELTALRAERGQSS